MDGFDAFVEDLLRNHDALALRANGVGVAGYLRRLFERVPPHQRHMWLERVHRRFYATAARPRGCLLVVWVGGGRVPLVRPHYRRIRERYLRPMAHRWLAACRMALKVIQKAWFCFVAAQAAALMLSFFKRTFDCVTFLNDSVGQVVSFLAEGYPGLVDASIRNAFARVDHSKLYFIAYLVVWARSPTWWLIDRLGNVKGLAGPSRSADHVTLWQVVTERVHRVIADSIVVECWQGAGGVGVQCALDRNTFIFRFSHVLANYLPLAVANSYWGLKTCTMLVLAIYLGCGCVFALYMTHRILMGALRLAAPYFSFVDKMSRSVGGVF